MRLGIKGKQIAGVTAIVGMAIVVLSLLNVARLAEVVLHESLARGELLAKTIFHRAREIVTGSQDPYAALRTDPGLRAILESSIYGESVTDASILDTHGTIIASSDSTLVGRELRARADLASLANEASPREQLRISLRARQLESMKRPDDGSLAAAYKKALDEANNQAVSADEREKRKKTATEYLRHRLYSRLARE